MKRVVVLCTAMMFVFLHLDAEVRSAEELFKRWFLKDALNQHVYTDVMLKKSSQDYDEVYGNLFKKHINKHKELLEPTFRFLNSCTGCNLHEFSQENFTISEKFKARYAAICRLLDSDVRGFVTLAQRKGLASELVYKHENEDKVEHVIDKYDKMVGSFVLDASKKTRNQKKFALANRFFEFCFDPKTVVHFDKLFKIEAYKPLANMLYSVIWKNLVGKGWISWHQSVLVQLRQEASRGKTIVYLAGGNDIYQLIKHGIFNIQVIDPMLGDTQSPYYIWDWEWFNKGEGENYGIGDELTFAFGNKKMFMKRENYEQRGSFVAQLSNKTSANLPQTITKWAVYECKEKTRTRVGTISFERRFVTQQDIASSTKKAFLASFNEGYYAFLPLSEGGWGLDLDAVDNNFLLYIKQLRKPISRAFIKNLVDSVLNKDASIKLGSCAT